MCGSVREKWRHLFEHVSLHNVSYSFVSVCVCEFTCLRGLISGNTVNLSLTPKSFSISQVRGDLSHLPMPPLKAEAK